MSDLDVSKIDEDDYWDPLNVDSNAWEAASQGDSNAFEAVAQGDSAASKAVKGEGGLIVPSLRLDSGYAFRRADELERALEQMDRKGRGGAAADGLRAQVEGYRADAEALQLADQFYSMFSGQARIAAGAVARMETTSMAASPIANELEGELKGKSKRMKVGKEAVKDFPDEQISTEQYAFTDAQRTFARSSTPLLGALQGDIPAFLRRAAKANKDKKPEIDDAATTVKTLGNRLRGLTGTFVATDAAGVGAGTVYSVNVVDESKVTSALNHCEMIEGVLGDLGSDGETALARFQHEARNFKTAVQMLLEAGRKMARVIASQRKLLVDAGTAADTAKDADGKKIKDGQGASKGTLTSALVSAGSIEEGSVMLEGAIDIARNTVSTIEQANGQILSHRNTSFKTTRGGRSKKDGAGGADVKLLEQAMTITQDWVKLASEKAQEWSDEQSSARNMISETGLSRGDL